MKSESKEKKSAGTSKGTSKKKKQLPYLWVIVCDGANLPVRVWYWGRIGFDGGLSYLAGIMCSLITHLHSWVAITEYSKIRG